MTTVITVVNQKGGVGKTTTVVNVAAFAALAGRRTLVIDVDPQANASSVLCREQAGTCVFSGQAPLATDQPSLWVIPAGADLPDHDKRLVMTEGGRLALRDRLRTLRSDFDLIVVDCPPSLGMLPTNALLAADALLVPIQCEYFAMEGLSQLLASVTELQEEGNPTLALAGILLTMFDDRSPLALQVAAELRRHFGERVLRAQIPRDVALAAAPSYSRTILDHDPLSPGGLAYCAATKELLDGLR